MKIIKKIKSIKHSYELRKNVIKEKKYLKVPFLRRLQMYAQGFKSDYWLLYNLKENDRKEFITRYEYYLTRDIDNEYKILFDDKILFEKVFSKYVNVAKTYAYIMDNNIYDGNDNIMNEIEFFNLIEKEKKILVKPIYMAAYKGIFIIEKKEEGFCVNNKVMQRKEIYELIKCKNKSIVTEFIEQTGYAHKIFPESVNTIRVVTIKKVNSTEYVIPYAVHRFGTEDTIPVDNASKGGLFCLIDVETGKLGKAKNITQNKIWDEHFNTHERIEGVEVPNWNKIKESLIKAHRQFPLIPFIAWDVAVTNDDYRIIEANKSSEPFLYQAFGKGLRNTELGEFYKYYCKFK